MTSIHEIIERAKREEATELDLSENQLTALPSEIGHLTKLQKLDLIGNQLTALPPEIGQLANLRFLDLSDNQLTALSSKIGQLTNLQSLICIYNQLAALPTEIGQLINLEGLGLSNNPITALSTEIGQLTRLQYLDLRDNQLTTLPTEIGQLTNLQYLDLSGNQLTTLPTEIGQLTNLQHLDLSGNQLTALPTEIVQLTNLQYLDLRDNQLTVLLSKIVQLTNLEHLDLSGNQLTALPTEIGQLEHLSALFLHGNDDLGLPPEVLGPPAFFLDAVPPSGILSFYFENRDQLSKPLLEAKILILGQGGVGKTSLVRRLVDDEFDPKEGKTEGIDIAPWAIPGRDESGEIRVNIWDFGGQEIMHATHQFFLTKRSLYVVVLDARKGEDEGKLHYWLRLIESYGEDSPVLVVTNQFEPPNLPDLNEYRLRKDYPNIQGFHRTSCRDGDGIADLKEAILRQIHGLGHVYNLVPATFLATKAALEEQTKSKDFLDMEEYRATCKEKGVQRPETQDLLLRFLHDLGAVLHFDDPDSPYQLAETKILNPEWVTRGVYRILNDVELKKKGGELRRSDVDRILSAKAGYPKDKRIFILGMMHRFELCFEYADGSHRYLVPELLPRNEPALALENEDALRFEYHYEILPEGVLPRFIVRMQSHIVDASLWRSGALLTIDGNRALVRGNTLDGRVFIHVFDAPTGRRRALTAIRAAFRAIHRTIPGLKPKPMVPLPNDPDLAVSYDHLLRLESKGNTSFLPEGADEEYSVRELLDGVEETRDLSHALAYCFDTEQSARSLLLTAGLTVEKLPSGSSATPLDYWAAVLREIEKGMQPGARQALLRAAAARYPDNPAFRRGR